MNCAALAAQAHAQIHERTHARTQTRVRANTRTHPTRTRTRAHTRTQHEQTCTHARTNMHARTHMHAPTHPTTQPPTHARTHARTHTPPIQISTSHSPSLARAWARTRMRKRMPVHAQARTLQDVCKTHARTACDARRAWMRAALHKQQSNFLVGRMHVRIIPTLVQHRGTPLVTSRHVSLGDTHTHKHTRPAFRDRERRRVARRCVLCALSARAAIGSLQEK